MENRILNDNIQLSLPVNAAYVSSVRLTASSIAYRMGFDIDSIEDIKAAVSEACTFVINKAPASYNTSFVISFDLKETNIEILIQLEKGIHISSDENEMSLVMINALVDKLEIIQNHNKVNTLKLTKYKKNSSF